MHEGKHVLHEACACVCACYCVRLLGNFWCIYVYVPGPRSAPGGAAESWHEQLAGWANRQLSEGQSNVLRQALPLFESIMIEAALRHTGGRKAEAAELLGWGRNTLTRTLKDLDLPA